MDKKVKVILIILLVVFAFVGAGYVYSTLVVDLNKNEAKSTPPPQSAAKAKSIPAMDFTLQNLEGKTVSLSDYKGKAVVLNFWASWCPPCKAEMPDFHKVMLEYKDNPNIAFIMVNLTTGKETEADARKYIRDNQFSFHVLLDTQGIAGSTYQVQSIPTTYFIDKNQNVVGGRQGMISEAVLRNGIAQVLDGE